MTIVNYNNLSNLIQLVKTYFYERQQDNYTFAFATKNDLQNTQKIKYNEANSQTICNTVFNNNLEYLFNINDKMYFKNKIGNDNVFIQIKIYKNEVTNNVISKDNCDQVMRFLLSEFGKNGCLLYFLPIVNFDINVSKIELINCNSNDKIRAQIAEFIEIELSDNKKTEKVDCNKNLFVSAKSRNKQDFIRNGRNASVCNNVMLAVSVMEHFYQITPLKKYVLDNIDKLHPHFWHIVFFQVFYALAIVKQKYPSFRHNSLTYKSIFICENEHPNNYNLYGVQYKLPKINFMVKIDGFSHSYVKNMVEYKTAVLDNDYYDIHHFGQSIYSFLLKLKSKYNYVIDSQVMQMLFFILPAKYRNTAFVALDETSFIKSETNIINTSILFKNNFFDEFIIVDNLNKNKKMADSEDSESTMAQFRGNRKIDSKIDANSRVFGKHNKSKPKSESKSESESESKSKSSDDDSPSDSSSSSSSSKSDESNSQVNGMTEAYNKTKKYYKRKLSRLNKNSEDSDESDDSMLIAKHSQGSMQKLFGENLNNIGTRPFSGPNINNYSVHPDMFDNGQRQNNGMPLRNGLVDLSSGVPTMQGAMYAENNAQASGGMYPMGAMNGPQDMFMQPNMGMPMQPTVGMQPAVGMQPNMGMPMQPNMDMPMQPNMGMQPGMGMPMMPNMYGGNSDKRVINIVPKPFFF